VSAPGPTDPRESVPPAVGADTPAVADAASPPSPAAEPAVGAPPGRGLITPLLVLGTLALGWTAYDSARELGALRSEVAQRLTATEESARRTGEAAAQALRAAREAESRLGAVESRQAESQSQQIALEALYQDIARGRDDALLAEVEQTIAAAAQQLALTGSVQVALVALQGADARLARLERPPFAPLRRALAADIGRLQALPLVDLAGLAQRLDRAVATVESLAPAPGATRVAIAARAEPPAASAPDETGWRSTLARVWAEIRTELRQLATVRRLDREAPPLLAPDQAWFLHENLRLRLLSARLALLARDEAGFRADLAAASHWLERYFDASDPAVSTTAATLAELSRATVRLDIPGVGESLEAARALRSRQDRRP